MNNLLLISRLITILRSINEKKGKIWTFKIKEIKQILCKILTGPLWISRSNKIITNRKYDISIFNCNIKQRLLSFPVIIKIRVEWGLVLVKMKVENVNLVLELELYNPGNRI